MDSLVQATLLVSLGAKLDERYSRADAMGVWDEPDDDAKDSVDIRKDRLEETIRLEHSAVNATPNDHPDQALHLNRLGIKLYELFIRTKAMTDLEEAIRIGRAAVDATPNDSAERTEYLGNLGCGLFARFHRTGAMSDLEEHIRIEQDIVDTTPQNHPARAEHLHRLGNGLLSLFFRTESMNHLDESIRVGQAAVDAAKFFSPLCQAKCFEGLGKSFRVRYHRTASAEDLDKAILNGQSAISTTLEDDPGAAECLKELACGLWARSQRTGSMDDLQEALNQFIEALYDSSSPEFDCLQSGMHAGYIASAQGHYDQGAQYLTECLHLLSKSVLRSNSHEDLQYILRHIPGLGSLAASVLLRAGRSTLESLQALEVSRGVISSFVIDSRFDASMLEERNPRLWSWYCYLRDYIAMSTLRSADSYTVATSYSNTLPPIAGGLYSLITLTRCIMIKELEVVKALIRKQPEFQRFQLPMTETELHGLARNGPIVSLNVTCFGSHAFLLTEQTVRVLPLPKFDLNDLQEYVSRNIGGNRSRRDGELVSTDEDSKTEDDSHPRTQIESMLWIWDVAVKPVLQELGLLWQYKPPPTLPCLWWVGGGLTSLLPLHAAGDHQPGSTENTMSHIVSSYAPSLKALEFSQKKIWKPLETQSTKIVIIKMHKTPGHADLNVEEEVASIKKYVGSSASIEVLETPTAETVAEKATACSLIHFACHGASDLEQPSKSALLLGKSRVEKLTIGDLQPLHHKLAQVAYLSACSTAELGARNLIDEGITMATTFQLAGFRHVIGTLWGVDDSAAAAVAAKFYEHLLKQDAGVVSLVARALHHAVLDLKAKTGNGDNILLWAPFIHVGP